MPELFFNDPGTTLNGTINNSTTTVVITSATGYPTVGNFRIRIDSEIMLVTAVSGTSLTVTRGVEGTTAASHTTGAAVYHVVTGGGITQANMGWGGYGPVHDSSTYATAPSFSWRNQGSATVTTYGNSFFLHAPAGSGDNFRGREITAPGTPYTITTQIIPQLHRVADPNCGMYVGDNGNGKLVAFGLYPNGNSATGTLVVFYFTNATTYSSTAVSVNFGVANIPIWLRINDTGTNFVFSWSSSGQQFYDVLTVSRTAHLSTPDRVGVYANAVNATYPAGMMVNYWKQT